MPIRKTPLITGEIYHVLNRSIEQKPIFADRIDYRRCVEAFSLYRFLKPPMRLSLFRKLSFEERRKTMMELTKQGERLIDIICYCLMPNHIHFLVKQLYDSGISTFMRKFTDSYSRYFNTKHKRIGHLFQGAFRAIRIETNEQLLHVSRYIHLNPVTAFIIQPQDLETYQWSSIAEFIKTPNQNQKICQSKIILDQFSSEKEYKNFLLDQVDYARKLKSIEHLIME